MTSRLADAAANPEARVLVMAGRTRGWKGAVAVHSWIVIKRENGEWRRYDVAGWGSPVRLNWWPPDLWFGEHGAAIVDLKGAEAETLIPRIEAAIKEYRYANYGDYRIWPGPNSNTFVATVLRAVPELEATLPPNAIGRDFRPEPYAGLTDSGTGVEANLLGPARREARLGRRDRVQRARSRRGPRSAPSGAQAAGLRPHRVRRRSRRRRRRSNHTIVIPAERQREPGPMLRHTPTFVIVARWVPDSRFAASGMTVRS